MMHTKATREKNASLRGDRTSIVTNGAMRRKVRKERVLENCSVMTASLNGVEISIDLD
jgi:hypothetical protein